MSKIRMCDSKGADLAGVDFPDDLMVQDQGSQAVHESVVRYQARRRAGTASTKSKGEVAGTGAKPWKQKGTGRARAGYKQSPVWRGGAAAFGPVPREYGGKINRKVSKLAFQRAFSEAVAGDEVLIVDEIAVESGKTKDFVAMLKAINVAAPALVVVDQLTPALEQAAQNAERVELTSAESLNTYQLLRYARIVISKAAMDALQSRLTPRAAKGATA
ncbi:MAG: 50S ribosomal protein L4 [Kiritimatiellia bacterium]|jgi:large subunit ribosomal protein L4|nr:50S ribosomal protein L4 [Kiritimatiellia bacterium]MDP6631614.1 50S ribosomal protein L4 [Kiritimatiellia bacterium]MDP6810213.1 50S ribosomal protein L4 [Kiritimatiellia bacterium]MDP7022881.1 50S ribosomal protein L4 [Kiritimatiellia bacterium]